MFYAFWYALFLRNDVSVFFAASLLLRHELRTNTIVPALAFSRSFLYPGADVGGWVIASSLYMTDSVTYPFSNRFLHVKQLSACVDVSMRAWSWRRIILLHRLDIQAEASTQMLLSSRLRQRNQWTG